MCYSVSSFKKRNCLCGFTIIELVMVIAIIGIVSVVIFTQFVGYYGIKGQAAAYKLIADIRYAQQLAVHRHENCGIVFDIGGNKYYVYQGNTSTQAVDPFSKGSFELDFDTDTECQGVQLSSTNFGTQLGFDKFGKPDPSLAAAGQVVLSYQGNSYTVAIEPQTGRVSLL